jgi:Reverse transcriptase (RNA-dependent DNA polymerase)
MNIEIEEEMAVLEITVVPERHFKDLAPREVNHIQTLKTFVVPAKVERIKGRTIIHKAIIFYQSDSTQSLKNPDHNTWKKWVMEQESGGATSDDTACHPFGEELYKLAKRAKCLRDMSKAEAKRFDDLWSGGQNKVLGLDGKIKYTRELGYNCDNATCSEESLDEYHSYQIRESYCIVAVEALEDESEEGSAPIPKEALKQLEKAPNTVDELAEINLGTEENPRPTFISASLPEEVADMLKTFLKSYMDCFAWSYKEMPGLDPNVAVHYLKIDPTFKPIKQAPRRMRIELEEKVVEETKKLIDVGFIREEETPEWVASIVPVKKKYGQIRICMDFRDLNKACPKDDFPLPVTEIIIDHTSSYEVFSFMDGYAGYNQIKMAQEDEKHIAFRMLIGIYCYKVMPFGLKNASATYQRAMTKIFDDLIHKIVECYVDDLVIKAMSYEEHLQYLEVVFKHLREHALKLNPLKCAFMVSSGKFLGFVVRHRGIEIDPGKIKAITELPPPKNLKQLRSLQGQFAYIRRFIANLSGKIQPFTRLTKKDIPFKWDGECQQAFEEIKAYLLNPPVWQHLYPGKSSFYIQQPWTDLWEPCWRKRTRMVTKTRCTT